MTCRACRKRISKSFVKAEIIDTVYVEGFPIGRWGRFDPPGFLCAGHSVLDRNNKDPYKNGALKRLLPEGEK